MQCVGADIEDLEYAPKPEFESHFKVTNTKTEVREMKRAGNQNLELLEGVIFLYI